MLNKIIGHVRREGGVVEGQKERYEGVCLGEGNGHQYQSQRKEREHLAKTVWNRGD